LRQKFHDLLPHLNSNPARNDVESIAWRAIRIFATMSADVD
jgi:hypothetical protein